MTKGVEGGIEGLNFNLGGRKMKYKIVSITIWKSDYQTFSKLYNRVKLFLALGDLHIRQKTANFVAVTGRQLIVDELY